nr:MAG TPA: tail collar fiber protein [Caudoviricetes sp.]
MSNWSTHQFTRKGEQLRAKVESGKCKLTLTKIKIGNGNVAIGEVKDMNDLKSPQLVLGISSCDVSAEDDRICEVVGIASSSNVESAFSVTEMGLYANDPDVGEILYLVGIDTAPDDMPNKNAQSPVTLTYQFELVTSNMANVVAVISPAGLVTVKMMNDHRTASELDHPDGSVTTAKIHNEAVTGEKIAKRSVTGDHIANGAIAKEHLSASIVTLISDSGIAILQRSRAYQVGDIAYHKSLPSWARLECVKAGTTAATLPTQIEQMVQNGGGDTH